MPSIDFFLAIIEVLATRYGWSHEDIAEKMYWEDVYSLYEYASNLNVMEKNEQMRFQFMLHASSKKAMNAWKDMDIPFPDKRVHQQVKAYKPKVVPHKLQHLANKAKMSSEQKLRYEYVKKRLEENQKRESEINNNYYNWHG